MDKEHVKKLAGDPKFITGIYNYCDRWCKRCPFTSRCMNLALVNEQFPDQESRDINNETFWRGLSETFRLTLDLLKEAAEREGIDLDAVSTEKDAEQEGLNDEIARNHECCRMAKAYAEMVDNWFNSAQAVSAQKDDLDFKGHMELPNVGPFRETDTCEDAVEVISGISIRSASNS